MHSAAISLPAAAFPWNGDRGRCQGAGEWAGQQPVSVGHFCWPRETLLKQHGGGGTVRVLGKALGRLTGRSQWQELVRRMAGAPSRGSTKI